MKKMENMFLENKKMKSLQDKVRLVLFDYDGTIADTTRYQHEFYTNLCYMYGMPRPWRNLREFREWVSGDWRENAKRLGTIDKEEETTRLYKAHRDSSKPIIKEEVVKVLRSPRHYKQGVLSSNEASYIERVLRENELNDCLDGIFGCDNLASEKPNPDALREVMNKFGVYPHQTVYVGDTVEDIKFARKAGTKVIGVTYGWQSKKRIQKANPDALVQSPIEIISALR